jgi:hypothetical protein
MRRAVSHIRLVFSGELGVGVQFSHGDQPVWDPPVFFLSSAYRRGSKFFLQGNCC